MNPNPPNPVKFKCRVCGSLSHHTTCEDAMCAAICDPITPPVQPHRTKADEIVLQIREAKTLNELKVANEAAFRLTAKTLQQLLTDVNFSTRDTIITSDL